MLWLSPSRGGACGHFLGDDGAWRAAAGLGERWRVAVVEVGGAVAEKEAPVVFLVGPSIELRGAGGLVRREELLRWCTSVDCLPAARAHEGQIWACGPDLGLICAGDRVLTRCLSAGRFCGALPG
jgi:hypothetical protein